MKHTLRTKLLTIAGLFIAAFKNTFSIIQSSLAIILSQLFINFPIVKYTLYYLKCCLQFPYWSSYSFASKWS